MWTCQTHSGPFERNQLRPHRELVLVPFALGSRRGSFNLRVMNKSLLVRFDSFLPSSLAVGRSRGTAMQTNKQKKNKGRQFVVQLQNSSSPCLCRFQPPEYFVFRWNCYNLVFPVSVGNFQEPAHNDKYSRSHLVPSEKLPRIQKK